MLKNHFFLRKIKIQKIIFILLRLSNSICLVCVIWNWIAGCFFLSSFSNVHIKRISWNIVCSVFVDLWFLYHLCVFNIHIYTVQMTKPFSVLIFKLSSSFAYFEQKQRHYEYLPNARGRQTECERVREWERDIDVENKWNHTPKSQTTFNIRVGIHRLLDFCYHYFCFFYIVVLMYIAVWFMQLKKREP